MKGRYPELLEWIRRRHRAGSTIYSACSGAVLLAATGLLERARGDVPLGLSGSVPHPLPRRPVPSRAEPRLRRSNRPDRDRGRHHVLARSGDPHHLAPLQPRRGAADRQGLPPEVARRGPAALCQPGAPSAPCRRGRSSCRELACAALPRAACGRCRRGGIRDSGAQPEAALQGRDGIDADRPGAEPAHRGSKAHPGERHGSFEDIAAEVGYENPAFFRRLFKRCTGSRPGEYRRMFRPFATAADVRARPNRRRRELSEADPVARTCAAASVARRAGAAGPARRRDRGSGAGRGRGRGTRGG